MEISVSKKRTINLGNYESEQIMVGITETVSQDDDFDKTYRWLISWVDEKLDQQTKRIRKEDVLDEGY